MGRPIDYTCINKFKAMNIHSGPSHSYPLIGILPINTTIICTEEENLWYKHDYGGLSGWSTNEGWKWLSIMEDRSDNVQKTDTTEKNNITKVSDINAKPVYEPIVNIKTTKRPEMKSSIDNRFSESLGKERGIYPSNEIDLYTKFNRFGYLPIKDRIGTVKEYSFYTKPDLNIFQGGDINLLNSQLKPYPIFVDAFERYPKVLAQLQRSVKGNRNPFMNLLYNTRKNTIDLPGITAKETETASNVYGSKIFYRKHSFDSDEGHEFNAEFEDYKNLDVYMLFKLYDEYERLKSLGVVSPPDRIENVENKILHDQFGIFKYIVDEDGETILFWAYLLGCFPKGVPRETFSEVQNELVYSIPIKSTVVLDSDPVILSDFNDLVSQSMTSMRNTVGIYSNKYSGVDPTWCSIPYIYKDVSIGRQKFAYKLKWKE